MEFTHRRFRRLHVVDHPPQIQQARCAFIAPCRLSIFLHAFEKETKRIQIAHVGPTSQYATSQKALAGDLEGGSVGQERQQVTDAVDVRWVDRLGRTEKLLVDGVEKEYLDVTLVRGDGSTD